MTVRAVLCLLNEVIATILPVDQWLDNAGQWQYRHIVSHLITSHLITSYHITTHITPNNATQKIHFQCFFKRIYRRRKNIAFLHHFHSTVLNDYVSISLPGVRSPGDSTALLSPKGLGVMGRVAPSRDDRKGVGDTESVMK